MSSGGALSTAFQLGYEISPIILVDGLAGNIPGSMLPIVALTEGINFVSGLLTGNSETSLDDFFAHFVPMPGSTLEENQIGMYPFANQAIAANAVIKQPLRISLRMVCPAKGTLGYAAKLATMSALKAALDQHINQGGTFTIATPAQIYANCILVMLKDVTTGETKQPQIAYQWDFVQPLVSLQQLQQALSQAMTRWQNGLPSDGSWSGIAQTTGFAPSGAAAVTQQAATPLAGVLPTVNPPIGGIGPSQGGSP